ncbi:MAG: hypothetical protein GY705_10880 [Bacteroidetes bacterium]|nr:hypothetical protein [Bacteroidota bacterium]
MKYLSFPFFFLFLLSFPVFGQQKSIKAFKQRTHFLYTSLNLQAGCFGDKSELHWLPIDRNPLNQLSLTYKSKSQRLLQKGYTPFLHLSAVKAKMSLAYDNDISSEGEYSSELKLSVQDIWIKLATKWDRTSLKFGNFSLPFGHNPKVDPDYSFIPNIGGTDLGLSRDFGFLFKTPVSRQLDLELALTSGGLLGSPLVTGQIVVPDGYDDERLKTHRIEYHGDWLFTGRLGNSVFKKNEFGGFVIMGKRTDAFSPNNTHRVYRVGFDWILKRKEKLRITNQLLLGPTVASTGSSIFKVIQQSNVEFFLHQQWIFYFTNNVQYISYSDNSIFKGSFAGGVAFALNPHTRVKLNLFSNHNLTDEQYEFGAFLQLVTGFGLKG